MKKIFFTTVLLVFGFYVASAQQDSFDEMFKEMQKMQKEMLKQFEQLELNDQGFQFFMDTTIIQNFGDLNLNDQLFQQLDPKMFEGIFGQIQEELSKMDEEDWTELEQLFKNFGSIMPLTPQLYNPDDSAEPKDKPVKNGKKKRKIYKM